MRAVGLFSGIGGLELGLERAGIATELLCEYWEPAATTLAEHFDADIVGDIRQLDSLPSADVVTAGFPCTDLSQVGRTAGIGGDESGLVSEVFRLDRRVPAHLGGARERAEHAHPPRRRSRSDTSPSWFEERGWNWAYRTVDSQSLRRPPAPSPRVPRGLANRGSADRPVRRRGRQPGCRRDRTGAYGFYWTEGNRGLGWGQGVTPTLKGGSKLGIASPPGVWLPGADAGAAIVRPSIEAGERLQGFRAGWTAQRRPRGQRWKLVGNAVTVPVAEWIGGRLVEPGEPVSVRSRTRLTSADAGPRPRRVSPASVRQWDVSEAPLEA